MLRVPLKFYDLNVFRNGILVFCSNGLIQPLTKKTTTKKPKHLLIWKSEESQIVSLESDVWTKNPPQDCHLVPEGFLAVLVIKSDYNLNKLDYHWPLWAPSIAKPPHTHTFMSGPSFQAGIQESCESKMSPSFLMKLALFEAVGGSVCQGFGPSFDPFSCGQVTFTPCLTR